MHFKQLGCQIVHASFHKIIVTTDKVKYEEANSHINFVIRTIQQKEQFRFITLQPTEFYKVLLFKDPFNWGGIRESSPDIVSAKWDMSNHLPEAI
jgi:DNA polymerase epsilon subunit 1